jgi:ribonuclease HI
MDLSIATNNEAEYRTLLAALNNLTGRIPKTSRSPAGYSLRAFIDSQLTVGQITQGGRTRLPTCAR